jgi:hypothetical protein
MEYLDMVISNLMCLSCSARYVAFVWLLLTCLAHAVVFPRSFLHVLSAHAFRGAVGSLCFVYHVFRSYMDSCCLS